MKRGFKEKAGNRDDGDPYANAAGVICALNYNNPICQAKPRQGSFFMLSRATRATSASMSTWLTAPVMLHMNARFTESYTIAGQNHPNR